MEPPLPQHYYYPVLVVCSLVALPIAIVDGQRQASEQRCAVAAACRFRSSSAEPSKPVRLPTHARAPALITQHMFLS